MTRIALTAALLALTTIASAVSANTTPPSTPPAANRSTVGGGVKNPWTLPYTLAIVTVPEPTSLGVLGLGCAALIFRRRDKR